MKLLLNGQSVELPDELQGVEIIEGTDRLHIRTPEGMKTAVIAKSGGKTHISYDGRTYILETESRQRSGGAASNGELHAPMPGMIVEVYVKEGDIVTQGQKLAVLEAMKTQQPITAPFSGEVSQVLAEKNRQVKMDELLIRVRRAE